MRRPGRGCRWVGWERGWGGRARARGRVGAPLGALKAGCRRACVCARARSFVCTPDAVACECGKRAESCLKVVLLAAAQSAAPRESPVCPAKNIDRLETNTRALPKPPACWAARRACGGTTAHSVRGRPRHLPRGEAGRGAESGAESGAARPAAALAPALNAALVR